MARRLGMIAGLPLLVLLVEVAAAQDKPKDRQEKDIPPIPIRGAGGPIDPELQARNRRFSFAIDPNAPVKELLPRPPQAKAPAGPLAADDLSKAFEIEYQSGEREQGKSAAEHVAFQIARARVLDAKKSDGYITSLYEHRPDLAGLPFVVGNESRSTGDRARHFSEAVLTTRLMLLSFERDDKTLWSTISRFWAKSRDKEKEPEGWKQVEMAWIAALTQILADGTKSQKIGLARALGGTAIPEASRALVRLAIFSDEPEVQTAALESLGARPAEDYTNLLLAGLSYPYPPVAKRSAEAITKLKRVDLADRLIAVLEASDPRAPEARKFAGKTGPVVREIVRINHLKSCMLCHAPASGDRDKILAGQSAPVPVPGEKVPSASNQYYFMTNPDFAIRFDVTYLRQDFSAKLEVADARPWPELQRFDFLIRDRLLDEQEAAAFTTELAAKNANGSPYHQAALAALKELTGKNLTAAEWRASRRKP